MYIPLAQEMLSHNVIIFTLFWSWVDTYRYNGGLFPLPGREETQGDLFLNLASSAGLPADFPLDAADFANEPGTADKMFSKICIAAQALWKILLEICRNCRYFMVCLGKKCCGERFKYAG